MVNTVEPLNTPNLQHLTILNTPLNQLCFFTVTERGSNCAVPLQRSSLVRFSFGYLFFHCLDLNESLYEDVLLLTGHGQRMTAPDPLGFM